MTVEGNPCLMARQRWGSGRKSVPHGLPTMGQRKEIHASWLANDGAAEGNPCPTACQWRGSGRKSVPHGLPTMGQRKEIRAPRLANDGAAEGNPCPTVANYGAAEGSPCLTACKRWDSGRKSVSHGLPTMRHRKLRDTEHAEMPSVLWHVKKWKTHLQMISK